MTAKIKKILYENTNISSVLIDNIIMFYVDHLIYLKEIESKIYKPSTMILIDDTLYIRNSFTTYNIITDKIEAMKKHNKCLQILEYNNNVILNTFSNMTKGEFQPQYYNTKEYNFTRLTDVHSQFTLLTNKFHYHTSAITNEYIFERSPLGVDVININTRKYLNKILFESKSCSGLKKILINGNNFIIISDKTIELYDFMTFKLNKKIYHKLDDIHDATSQENYIYILYRHTNQLYIDIHTFNNLEFQSQIDLELPYKDKLIKCRIAANNKYLCLVKPKLSTDEDGYFLSSDRANGFIKVFLV